MRATNKEDERKLAELEKKIRELREQKEEVTCWQKRRSQVLVETATDATT